MATKQDQVRDSQEQAWTALCEELRAIPRWQVAQLMGDLKQVSVGETCLCNLQHTLHRIVGGLAMTALCEVYTRNHEKGLDRGP